MINVKANGKVLAKAQAVSVRRLVDGLVFRISSPCILRLPDGLLHVTGEPQEELDTAIWDIRQKFAVLNTEPSSPTNFHSI